MENIAPSNLAADWDNVGLQVGSNDAKVKTILLTLDVTDQVIEEAVKRKTDLIISHHPITRGEIKSLNTDDSTGRRLWMAANSGINVFVAHTNLDACQGGVSDVLAAKIGLKEVGVLLGSGGQEEYKLVCFVPPSHVDIVTEAIVLAGGGVIGDYTYCTFRASGTGTFKPGEKSRPFVKTGDEIEKVEEIRLETRVSRNNIAKVVSKMLEVHPYEEVAYDIHRLEDLGADIGWGRIGKLDEVLPLGQYIEIWQEKLGLKSYKICGDLSQEIEWVAVCGGSGGNLISFAKEKGAQVFITGDIKYHDAQLAEFLDLAIIDAGHYQTERVIISKLACLLKERLKEEKGSVQVLTSEINTNPWSE